MHSTSNRSTDTTHQSDLYSPANNPSNSSAQAQSQETQQNQQKPRMVSTGASVNQPLWQPVSAHSTLTPTLTTTTSTTFSSITTTTSSTNTSNTLSHANTSARPTAAFGMAAMEKEWDAIITLRTRAQAAKLEHLPTEIKFEIFQHLTEDEDLTTGLVTLAKTAKNFHKEVKAFLTSNPAGIDYTEVLLADDIMGWEKVASLLKEETSSLRGAFQLSCELIRLAITNDVSVDDIAGTVANLKGVQLNFSDLNNKIDISKLVGKLHDQVIKLNAKGIGRERFLAEVMPALSSVRFACPVVLDASDNGLLAEDLQMLVHFMDQYRCIYRLDLSNNPLCTGKEVCMPMVELFHTPSPLSHLYLENTGFNDQTASWISESLAHNPCLQHLDLRANDLCDIGALDLIDAVGSYDSETDAVHVNTVMKTLRLQENHYGHQNTFIFTTVMQANLLVARHLNPNFDSENDELPNLIQVDGVGGGISGFSAMHDVYGSHFERTAKAEKL